MTSISIRNYRWLAMLAVTLLIVAFTALGVTRVRAATVVWLLPQQQGSIGDCDGGSVTWHFVLNGLDKGTAPGSLSADFSGDGTVTDPTGSPVGIGKTQHFFVTTTTTDTLLNASATVNDQTGTPMLLLSEVFCGPPPSGSPQPTPS